MAMGAQMVWATMAGVIQADPQQAQQVWDGLARARAPEVRALLVQLTTLGQRVCAHHQDAGRAYPWALTTLLHTHRMVHRLDVLASERPDLRAVIRQVQAAFLQYAGLEGLGTPAAPPSQGQATGVSTRQSCSRRRPGAGKGHGPSGARIGPCPGSPCGVRHATRTPGLYRLQGGAPQRDAARVVVPLRMGGPHTLKRGCFRPRPLPEIFRRVRLEGHGAQKIRTAWRPHIPARPEQACRPDAG